MEIKLRKWEMGDIDRICQGVPQVDSQYLRYDFPSPFTKKDALVYIDEAEMVEAKGLGLYRAIVVDGVIIGNVSLNVDLQDTSCATIGYYILKEYYGKGICTKAVKDIIAEALKKCKLKKILAYINTKNVASQRVLEKNGFKLFTTLENETIKDNEIVNVGLYLKEV